MVAGQANEGRDSATSATRTPAIPEKNPNGRIPVLELGDGSCLAESDAILFYRAEGTPLPPADRLDRAQVPQWMLFGQYSHEPYIAVCPLRLKHLEMTVDRRALLAERQVRRWTALEVMERHFEGRAFFVGVSSNIADIALYANTHVASERGFDLAGLSGVCADLQRIRGQPAHKPIAGTSD